MNVSARALQRHVDATDDSHRVTSLELFFDLAFGMKQVVNYVADTGHHELGDRWRRSPSSAMRS